MLNITSREYKVMLDQRMFADRKVAAASLWRELRAVAERIDGFEAGGEFDKTKKREIAFLDTPDATLLHNGLVLRQRHDLEDDETEYTLKCRSPDRYIASGADLRSAEGLKSQSKFEEDIAAPFHSRFSRSNTVTGPDKVPKNIGRAAEFFPSLGKLRHDGEICSPKIELRPTNSQRAYERVLTGPTFRVDEIEMEVALILWSDGAAGRPLVAEFSFRYGIQNEDLPGEAASSAMRFFLGLQRLDWCLPDARTKTQYAYGETA